MAYCFRHLLAPSWRAPRQSYHRHKHSRLSCAVVLSALLCLRVSCPSRSIPLFEFFLAVFRRYLLHVFVYGISSCRSFPKVWRTEATFLKFFYPALYLLKLTNLLGVGFEGLRSVFGWEFCLDFGFMRLRFWRDCVFWTLVLYYLHVSTVSEVFLLYL